MLVLSRKCQQAVVVEGCGGPAQKLTVTVVEIRGGRVKLGFDVAKEVVIHRHEVWEQIHGKEERQMGNDGSDLPARGSGLPGPPLRRRTE